MIFNDGLIFFIVAFLANLIATVRFFLMCCLFVLLLIWFRIFILDIHAPKPQRGHVHHIQRPRRNSIHDRSIPRGEETNEFHLQRTGDIPVRVLTA